MQIDSLCRYATSVCYEVAPRDLGDTPLYIVPYSRLPHFPAKTVCAGFTQPSLDLYLKDQIPTWWGRGPCMVIDDVLLRSTGSAFQIAFVGVALHELAHILERAELYQQRENATPEVIKKEAEHVAAVVASKELLHSQHATNPLSDHGGKWLRIAFHLHHRAVAIGEPLIAELIVDTTSRGLSSPKSYADAIAGEASRMRDATFREIVATNFPEEFSRLWTTDVVRWLNSQQDKEKGTDESH